MKLIGTSQMCALAVHLLKRSVLGKRERPGEHEAMRKIKNEFMSNWDGLKTKDKERVIVLAATNRPFDLDDAVLRRLPRRLLVDLPSHESRVKILKVVSFRLLRFL